MFKTGYVKIPPHNTATLKIPFVEERKGARGGCDLYDHPIVVLSRVQFVNLLVMNHGSL